MTNTSCARNWRLRTAAATLMSLCIAAQAAEPEPAPPGELAQMREQLVLLRQTLDRIDQRLQQLERPGTPAPVESRPAPPSSAQAIAPLPAPATAVAPMGAPAPAPLLGAHEQAVLEDQVRTVDALSAWRQLRAGMRQEEVRRLLGEPQSTLAVGNRTGWVYSYRNAGRGSVFFSHDGIVVSLISPGQGALHLY